MRKIVFIVLLFFTLLLSGCNSNSYTKYPDEIKEAYNYVYPNSQETIKNWKKAKVEDYTPTEDLEVIDKEEDKHINIKGIETLKITFKTTDDGNLGPIVVFIDKDSKEILGIGARK